MGRDEPRQTAAEMSDRFILLVLHTAEASGRAAAERLLAKAAASGYRLALVEVGR